MTAAPERGDGWRAAGARASRMSIAALILAACVCLAGAGGARATVVWLCNPALPSAQDPCDTPLDTTDIAPNGASRVYTPERVSAPERPVDCFYVYPTISNQLTLNATQAKDPPVVAIAKWQASRFSTVCRMFAPVYRQVTIAGLASLFVPGGPAQTAYSDVLEAWRQYLAQDNDGRGVILIGHSQGSLMLRELIRTQIDPYPNIRRLLVGAFLFGGNVMVRKGQTTGGDFQHIPLCTEPGQDGCVVAYSTWSTDPGPDAFVGNSSTDTSHLAFGFASGPDYDVACTDPAVLSADVNPLSVLVPTSPFPQGAAAVGLQTTLNGPVPAAPTTWVQTWQYTGSCQTINGAHVFRYNPIGDSRQLHEFPPTWGTHFMDMNLGLQQLVTIAGDQTQTWLSANFTTGPRAFDDKRDGTATVSVTVPGAGLVGVTGTRTVRRFRIGSLQPGTVTVRIVPTRRGRRILKRRRSLNVTVSIIYRPYVGQAITRTRRLHLVLILGRRHGR
jgi:Protein of unknown function (DUF3089)